MTELSSKLVDSDVEAVRVLICAGELTDAFEDLCTQLYERGAICTSEQVARLASVGEAISVHPRYWEMLEVR